MTTHSLFSVLEQIDADKPFSDEEEKRLDTTRNEQTRREKKKRRKGDCGKFANWYNPHSGKRTGFIFRCGLFRDCETCLKRRADQEYELIKTASLEKRMIAKIMTPKQATRLIRKMDKTEYVRFPQENGNDLLLLDEEASEAMGIGGVEVDLHWVVRQNWETLVQTPKGRNKSGTMHIPASDDEPEEFTIITTSQFVTNANRGATIKAMKEAEQETANLDPRTSDEVVSALHKRTSVATRKLRELGFHTTLYSKRLKLVHGLIDWTGRRQIKRQYTENPTRANTNGSAEFSAEGSVVPTQASIPVPIS